jgi:hypothetical protein
MKMFLSLCVAVALVGCATASSNINRLGIGMTKAEVLQAMGQPQSTSADKDAEVLLYRLGEGLRTRYSPDGTPMTGQATGLYRVRLESGKVVSFGRVGD